MGPKIEVDCEECVEVVGVKSIFIDRNGKVYLILKCGHRVGFGFASVIHPRPETP